MKFFDIFLLSESIRGYTLGGCKDFSDSGRIKTDALYSEQICKNDFELFEIGRENDINFTWKIKTETNLVAMITGELNKVLDSEYFVFHDILH